VTGLRSAASFPKGFAFGPRRRQAAAGKFSRYTSPVKYPTSKSLHLHVLDHDLTTLTECTLGFISHVSLREITRRRPKRRRSLLARYPNRRRYVRDWIVNVGQRPAPSRLAHIIVELRERLKVIGQVQGARFEMPLTQEQIGEAMGITSVHANRIVKQLRDDNVLSSTAAVSASSTNTSF